MVSHQLDSFGSLAAKLAKPRDNPAAAQAVQQRSQARCPINLGVTGHSVNLGAATRLEIGFSSMKYPPS